MEKNKAEMVLNLVTIEDLAKVTGTEARNIKTSYIQPRSKRDKSKMLKALVIGTYMMKRGIGDSKDVEVCADIFNMARERANSGKKE